MYQKLPSPQGLQSLWQMVPEERVDLVECQKLCLGCLTPGHGRPARACPYKEERVDACKKSACKASHHYLLHVERASTKAKQVERPPTTRNYAMPMPTLPKGQESAVQLVAQWIDTLVGEPCLVFWDTGSQVILTTHKAAQAMKLQAIPSTPLNIVGISDSRRSKATVCYKVPLVDTGG
jgi:hypothetical protein